MLTYPVMYLEEVETMPNTQAPELGDLLDIMTVDFLGFTSVVDAWQVAPPLELLLDLADGRLVHIKLRMHILLLHHVDSDYQV